MNIYSRRCFLSLSLAVPVWLVATRFGCRRIPADIDPEEADKPYKVFVRPEPRFFVPGRFFFPERSRNSEPLYVTAFAESDPSRIVVQFSNGKSIVWDKSASYLSEARNAGGKAQREAIALKVLAAYALPAVYFHLINTKARILGRGKWESDWDILKPLHGLFHDFESFQRQSVLNDVTVGSLYELITTLSASRTHPQRIVWDAIGHRFAITCRPGLKCA